MADNEVILTVTARDEASGTLNKAKDTATGLTGTLGELGKIASGVGLERIGEKGIGFLKDSLEAAAEDEAGQRKLQQAIENTGVSWADYKKSVEGVIDVAQKKGFTDDSARNALSLLAAQTGNAEEAQKRFSLAMDLSRGSGLDLETSSRLLGKVTEDNVTALQRYGIHVAKGASETELFAAVQQKFGGQADVFANSTAGQMARVKISIHELQEEIGGFLLPIVGKLAEFATGTLIPAVSDFVQQVGDGIEQVKQWTDDSDAVQGALAKVRDVLGAVNPYVQDFISFLKDHQTEVKIFAAAVGGALVVAFTAWAVSAGLAAAATLLALAPIILVGAAIGLLAIGIYELITHWDEIKAKTVEVWGAIASFMQDKLGVLVDLATFVFEDIKNQVITAFNIIRDIFTIAMAVIHGDWGAAWDGIKQLVTDVWDGIKTAIELRFGLVRDLVTVGMGLLLDVVRYVGAAILNWFIALPDAILSALGDLSGLLTDIGSEVIGGLWDGMKSKFEDVKDWVSGLGDDIKSLKGPIEQDRVMLVPEAKAIMEGFHAGLKSGWEPVRQTIAGFSNAIPALAAPTRAAAPTQPSAPGTTIVNNYITHQYVTGGPAAGVASLAMVAG